MMGLLRICDPVVRLMSGSKGMAVGFYYYLTYFYFLFFANNLFLADSYSYLFFFYVFLHHYCQ
jgi:hypothetical protein